MRYRFNQFELDTQQFTLSHNAQAVAVEPKVFDLIVYLIEHRQRLISRDELFDKLWAGREVSDTTLSNHIKSARKVLGDNAERQETIKTLRGRGYQFVAAIDESDLARCHTQDPNIDMNNDMDSDATSLSEPSGQPQPKAETTHHTRTTIQPPNRLQTRLYQVVIIGLVAVIAAILFNPTLNPTLGEKEIAESENSLHRIAVLPFQNLRPDTETDYLGFAMADQIIGELTRFSGLTVRGSGSIRQYQNKTPAPEAVAKSLSIDYLLNGTYLNHNGSLSLNIELIDISTHQLLWRETVTAPSDQLFAAQTTIANKLLNKLPHLGVPQIRDSSETLRPSNALAYELYLRAVAAPTTNQGATLALEMLNQAQQLDPDYAPILVALGQRTHFLSVFNFGGNSLTEQAIDYYHQALALMPDSHSALSSLAKIYAETGETAKAIELSRQLVTLNEYDAQAQFSLGYSYRYAGMIEQSIEHMKIAIDLDPTPRWSHTLSISYISIEQYQNAMEALEVGADTPYSLGWKASIHLHQGEHEQALKYLDRVIEMEPDSFWEYDSQGFRAFITQDIEKGIAAAKKLEAADVNDSEATFYWATIYALLGDKQSALRMLNKAVDNGYFNYPLFQRETHLDSLRQDPEFQKLLEKVERKHLTLKQQLEL